MFLSFPWIPITQLRSKFSKPRPYRGDGSRLESSVLPICSTVAHFSLSSVCPAPAGLAAFLTELSQHGFARSTRLASGSLGDTSAVGYPALHGVQECVDKMCCGVAVLGCFRRFCLRSFMLNSLNTGGVVGFPVQQKAVILAQCWWGCLFAPCLPLFSAN